MFRQNTYLQNKKHTLTCQKVGLVVIDLITSPVVSWRGWETPPPPAPWLSCHSLLNHRRVKTSLSCGDLLLSSARLCLRLVDVDWNTFSSLWMSIFLSVFGFYYYYVKGIKDLSRGGGQEVWCLPGAFRSGSSPHLY